jgi:hypothetical protein
MGITLAFPVGAQERGMARRATDMPWSGSGLVSAFSARDGAVMPKHPFRRGSSQINGFRNVMIGDTLCEDEPWNSHSGR